MVTVTLKKVQEQPYLSNALMQSNNIVYVPDNISGVIPSELSGDIRYNTFTPTQTSITIGTNTVSYRTEHVKINIHH